MKPHMGIRGVYLYPHLTSALHCGVVYKECHVVSLPHKILASGSQHDQSVFTASSEHRLLPFRGN